MSEDKESVIKKIQALLRMSNDKSASENEMMMAASKAQELLGRYNLNLSEVKDADHIDEPIDKEEFNEEESAQYSGWKSGLYTAAARLYMCRYYHTRGVDEKYRKVRRHVFIGRQSNRIVCKEMCKYFEQAVKRIADNHFETVPGNYHTIRSMKRSFILGAVSSLSRKIHEHFEDMNNIPHNQVSLPGTRLPKLYADEQGLIDLWLKNKGIRLRSGGSTSIRDREAYSRGKAEGRGVSLHTQVSATSGKYLN
jgi:hypothetical protein